MEGQSIFAPFWPFWRRYSSSCPWPFSRDIACTVDQSWEAWDLRRKSCAWMGLLEVLIKSNSTIHDTVSFT